MVIQEIAGQVRNDKQFINFSGNSGWKRLSIALIPVLWLYLFLPFRPFGLPALYGQIEEWTLSAGLLSAIVLLLFVSDFKAKRFIFRITVCDILLFLYLIYILFRLNEYLYSQNYILPLFTLALLYLVIRKTTGIHARLIIPLLAISLIAQIACDYYQHDNTWKMVPAFMGVYHNTGIWGGFVSIVCVGIYGILLYAKKYKIFLSILLLFSIVVLVYSQSRAAWIGSIGGTVFLSFFFLLQKYGSKMIKPAIIAATLAIPLIIFAEKVLYQLKPVSADGRLYIWKISSRMLAENPLFGIGVDKFKSKYMYYQADYFSHNPDSRFAQIADEVNVPFCEPLKIIIEQGITGLTIFLAILFTALLVQQQRRDMQRDNNNHVCYRYAALLITLVLFSCFSYPFLFIQFHFLLIACLSILSRFQAGFRLKAGYKTGRFALILYLLVTGFILFGAIRHLIYMKKMHTHIVYFDSQKPEETLTAFTKMESILMTDPNFLVFYSNFLFMNKKYEQSIEKLTESMSYNASYSSCIELGCRYEQSGDANKALECWTLASRMIPSRFEPLYLQIRNHHRNSQYGLADSLTSVFMQKERKVDAIRIDRMMKDVREWKEERLQQKENKTYH